MNRLKRNLFALPIILTLIACEQAEEVTPKSPFHGIHGIGFDKQGRLLAGSVLGSTLYAVDVEKGTSSVFVPPPYGQADDVAFNEAGQIVWTAFLEGKVYVKDVSGEIRTIAEKLPGINSIDFAPNGKLYATQVFLGDALYELDIDGKKPPRKIMEKMGGLNGFEIGDDGKLYGPLWFKGKVVQVDLEKAKIKTIASGFKVPAAVNFDPSDKNLLYVVDTAEGKVVRINLKTSKKEVVANVKSSIDNLAFDKSGRLFISNMADNAIIEIDKKTGASKDIISGKLAAAGGLAIGVENGKETLYVADVFSLRSVDLESGEVKTIARMFGSELDYPINIKLTNKHILLTGWSSGAVQVIDRKTKKSLALLHGFKAPHDVVEMPNGDLLVAEFTKGTLVRLSGKGWKNKKLFASGFAGPANLLLDKDKKQLYVLENLSGRLLAFDLKTRKITPIVQGLQGAEGLAIDDNGRFIIAETKLKRIISVSNKGERKVLESSLPINGFPNGAIPTMLPTGIAVGNNGWIYFTSDEFANIWKIKTDN